MSYDDFQPVVDLVLNNWTALQLAVEHGMGAPGGPKTAQLMSAYVARYCVENRTDVDDLTEVLEDLMDEEFETVCHDNSPKEIATVLLMYLQLIREGRQDELKTWIDAMPKCQIWLSQPIYESKPPQSHGNPDDDTTSSSGDSDAGMNEDILVNGHLNSNTTLSNGYNGQITASNGQANGHAIVSNGEASTSGQHDPEPMDEDGEPGWTVVRTRRKK